MKKLWPVLVVAAALSLAFGFLPPLAGALAPRFAQTLPWALSAQLVLMLSCALALVRRKEIAPWTMDVRLAAGVGVAVAALLALSIPAEFRILADETNLVSTSLGLFRSFRADNITMAQTYYNTFHVLASEPAARPLLFPMLMTVLHCLFGFDPLHGFTVNVIATALSVMGVVLCGMKLRDRTTGILAALLMASLPIFQLVCRASGFEPVNLAVLAFLLLAMMWFTESPSLLRYELLVWLALLAGQCRYESVLMLLPVGVLGLLHWRALLDSEGSGRLAAIPLCVVPLIWQRHETSVVNGGDTIKNPFGIQYVWPHLKNAAEFFFDPMPGHFPVVPLISVLAVIGAVLLVWEMVKAKRIGNAQKVAALVYTAGIVVIFGTHVAYYLGDLRAPFIGRYVLSYFVPFSLAAAYPLVRLWTCDENRLVIGAAVLGCLGFGLGVSAQNDYGRPLLLYREYRQSLALLAPFKPESTLVVSDRPGMYAAHQYGAVSFDWLAANVEPTANNIRRHLFEDVIVFQKVPYASEKPEPAVAPAFKLKTLKEYQNAADYFIRISRVDDVDMGAIGAKDISASPHAPDRRPAKRVGRFHPL